MLTKELQAPGRWDIGLKVDTPEHIRKLLVERGHVMFFDQYIDPRRFSDDDLKALSVYTGRLLIATKGQGGVSPMRISGDHLTAWLGDADGRGEILFATKSYTAEPWDDFIDDILPTAIVAGNVTTTPGNVDGDFFAVSRKVAIDEAAILLGAEYRVNDDGTFDSGIQSELYVTDPTALIVRRDSSYDISFDDLITREPSVQTYSSTELESSIDASDWVSRVFLAGQGDFAGGGEDIIMGSANLADLPGSPPNPYLNFQGLIDRTGVVLNDPVAFVDQADAKAAIALASRALLTQKIRLNMAQFDISGSFEAGDTVLVYDPPETVDAANETPHEGRYIYPAAIRVFSISTPVKNGMGVVYRDLNGTYADLTPYIEWETGSAEITIGDRFRSPFDPIQNLLFAMSMYGNLPPNAITTPDIPTNTLPWLSTPYQDGEGKTFARVQVAWTEPLNTNTSVISDGSHYVVKYRKL